MLDLKYVVENMETVIKKIKRTTNGRFLFERTDFFAR